jgi:hypothetical protein
MRVNTSARVQVRQDQRNGLGMLAQDELRQLLGVGTLQRVETRRRLKRPLHAIDDALGLLLAQRPLEHAPGVVKVAARGVVGGKCRQRELFEDGLAHLGRDDAQCRHLFGHTLDFVLVQVAEDLRGELLADQHRDDRRLTDAGQRLGWRHYRSGS